MIFQTLLFKSHLAEDEKLLYVIHKHWVEITAASFQFLFFGILIPGFLYVIFPPLIWICLLWCFIAFLRFFYDVVDWYLDAWLVTNVSIIDVEWKGLFHRTSSRVDFTEINEVSWEIQGFLGTILRFGEIVIQTNVGSSVSLPNARSPKKGELVILKVKDQVLHQQKMTDTSALQDLLCDLVQKHINEHGLPDKKE